MLTESSTQFTDQPRDADAVILIQHARIADLESQVECLQKQLQERKRFFNHVYPCRLKSPKIVSTYNQVDTYDGEQESFISTIGRGTAERWPLSV